MMPEIISTTVVHKTPWLSLYSRKAVINGKEINWSFASRSKDPQPTLQKHPHAVLIVSLLTNDEGRFVVLTSEFRVPVGSREISFPAGLVEPEESAVTAAERELKEEVGLDITSVRYVSPVNLCSSAGLCDEMVQIVFCEATGIPTNKHAESSEDIEILLVKQEELRDLLDRQDVAFSAKAWCILWGMVYGDLWR